MGGQTAGLERNRKRRRRCERGDRQWPSLCDVKFSFVLSVTGGKMAKVILCRSKVIGSISLVALACYIGFEIIYWPVHIDICPDPNEDPGFYNGGDKADDLTIVTMFLNIGSIYSTKFYYIKVMSSSVKDYHVWLHSWSKINNRVVAFFDDDSFIKEFKAHRFHLPKEFTTILKVSKDNLPAFRSREQVEQILRDPLFTPSYAAEYTCTMDAKYDALDLALSGGHVRTKYVAWMDIGLFRKIKTTDPLFSLAPPPGLNTSRVGVSQVTARSEVEKLSETEIYRQNIVWVAGGFLIAIRPVMVQFIRNYREISAQLKMRGLADTDQQVIASMYSPTEQGKYRDIQLTTYSCPRGAFGLYGYKYLYFCLPYICKASSECKARAAYDATPIKSSRLIR
ncbi:hypothetical protein RRG08_015872 [Elysia crispata]|uniref:Uncharacterized protein n=1 Tax=Elysia crispata TaxID=231223 RepID=A0AAE0YLG4_9GAST|nr:hypothetical protein RRG08_015872 [Elysia crispata]